MCACVLVFEKEEENAAFLWNCSESERESERKRDSERERERERELCKLYSAIKLVSHSRVCGAQVFFF